MPRRSSSPLPPVSRILAALGDNIRLARVRRGLAAGLVAERAGMSRPTLRAIERGDAAVTIGAVANVLDSLGMASDLAEVARADVTGRRLEDAKHEATQRVRAPRRGR
jgi:transcriptional regulator with XRE-family HTH domain